MVAKKANKKTKNSEVDLLAKISSELFKLMGLKAKPQVTEDIKNEAFLINIEDSEEVGLIIGNRGQTLNSIQMVIGMIYRKNTGEWKRILVNISDWREKEEERLRELAQHSANRAKETGIAQYLYNLNSSQRRMVHLALSEDKDVQTESQGEGKERFLVVSPKK